MSRYEDAIEKLATRGTSVGATELLERVERELADHVVIVDVERRRLSGLVAAAAVFVVVMVFGGLWAMVGAPERDVASNPGDSEIEWINLDDGDEVPTSVTAGPGGFIRVPFVVSQEGPALEFSSDGRAWSPVELPEVAPLTFVRSVVATDGTWLIWGSDGDVMSVWVSSDAVTWTAVVWSDGLNETISEVFAAGGGFLALSRDAFGVGTTLWRSSDGEQWVPSDLGGVGNLEEADLRGTAGGFVWLPSARATGESIPIYHSVDGTDWVEGRIDLPAEYSQSPVRWKMGVVEFVGDQWIAIGRIDRTAADPVVHVWVSRDGITWTARGIPEFGQVDDRAVILSTNAVVIADRLVVAPEVVPLSVREDGIVAANGSTASTREIWATQDGATWTRTLRTAADISSVAGRTTDSGLDVGVWVSRPVSDEEQPVVTTTAPSVAPQELDQEGLDLQREILADGIVTKDEFSQALDGWKGCMEQRGLIDVSFEINPQGGWSSSYGSPDEFAGEAENAACSASYVDRVADGIG